MLFFACCWLCSSLCLLLAMLFFACLAMLFFACCWLCSSLCLLLAMLFFMPAVGFALDVLLHVLIPAVGYALSFLLHVFVPAVSLGGPPDCNANSLFQLCYWLFSSPCACHPRLFSAYPNSILWVASFVQVTVVLRHRAMLFSSLAHRKRARQSDIASFYFSTTGSSGCGSFSVLLTSPSASGVFLGRHFMVVYYGVIVGLVPPTPLLGAAPLRDQRHYSVLRHFVIIGSR